MFCDVGWLCWFGFVAGFGAVGLRILRFVCGFLGYSGLWWFATVGGCLVLVFAGVVGSGLINCGFTVLVVCFLGSLVLLL